MSLYITGIEMPKEEPIIVKICPDGDVCGVRGGIIAKAIPVPPHGRLGDLDELEKLFKSVRANASAIITHNSPTIIPADETNT